MACLPRNGGRVAPDGYGLVLEDRLALGPGAETFGQSPRPQVGRVDVADRRIGRDAGMLVGAGGAGGFQGVALAFEPVEEVPAKLGLVPAVVVDHADPADEVTRLGVDREEAVAAQRPVADVGQDAAPDPAPPANARGWHR